MACQKAVVSTTIGCAGLGLKDGYDVIVRDDSATFSGAICDLLADAARREAIAAQARRTVEQRFSWQAIAAGAYRTYQEMLGVSTR
jgi:glycosyltransferase involved in cell wall biosynthesis